MLTKVGPKDGKNPENQRRECKLKQTIEKIIKGILSNASIIRCTKYPFGMHYSQFYIEEVAFA